MLLPLALAFVLAVFFSFLAVIAEAAAALIAAYLWRGRWLIEATTNDHPPEKKLWEARGWRGSRRKAVEVARQLETRLR